MTDHTSTTETDQVDYAPIWAVLGDVIRERERQHEKWGQQNHPNGTGPGQRWPGLFSHTMESSARIAKLQVDHEAKQGVCTYGGILLEEVFEAMAEADPERLRAELIQVAAVSVAWVEKLDRDSEAVAE